MGDQKYVVQVDPIQLIPQLRVGVDEVSGVAQPVADVVDQDVDPAIAIQHGARQTGNLVGVADVCGQRQCRPAARGDLGRGCCGELGAGVGDDDLRTVCGEQSRGCRADAAASARHHRDPIGQQQFRRRWRCHRSYFEPLGESGDNPVLASVHRPR